MKYQGYENYKASGFIWLGKIPAHWISVLLKRVAEITYGIGGEIDKTIMDGVSTISLPNVKIDGTLDIFNEEVPKAIIDEKEKLKLLLKKGDLLFNWRNGSADHLGKTAIFNLENEYSHVSFLLKIRVNQQNIEPKFLHYLLNGYRISGFFKHAKAGVNNTFNLSELSNLPVIIPDKIEQKSIANFLDRETARIDALIEKKQKLIQLLKEKRRALITKAVTKGLNPDVKMKESGIDWLGDIPEHWEVKKLKYISKIVLGKMLTPTDKGGSSLKPYLRAQNLDWINPNIADIKTMWFAITELSKYRVKKNDLLVSEGGEVGRTCIWSDELSEVYIQNSVNKVTIEQGNPYYYLFLLYAFGQYGFFDAIVSRVSIGHLTKEKLKEIFIIAPPYDEQVIIVEHIQKKRKIIESLIHKVEIAIKKHKEYRTALISAAVTGKIAIKKN